MPSALNTLNLVLMAVLLVAAISVHAEGADQMIGWRHDLVQTP
ncbi:hypothetical protein [Aestuariicoccus sp. MJ-SS9]|nr:hypothetical protein [Aestuariicoccus sp. MJ-SS9]MDU8913573.1 hypothetical protein [Aestuariicoccus sp. MJ-SS9]